MISAQSQAREGRAAFAELYQRSGNLIAMLRGVVGIFVLSKKNGPDVSGQAVPGLRQRALIEQVSQSA